MLYVCVRGVMDVVFSVCIVTRGAVDARVWKVCVFRYADVVCLGCCCLPTPLTLVCGGEPDHPVSGPPASLSLHLASSSIIPAGSVHKSRGDNVMRMWMQLKR